MAISQNFPFTDEVNYNQTNTEIAAGVAKLTVVANPSQTFSQAFTSASGFTLDAAKAEFSGGLLRQKDQRLTGATFGANYVSSINANWANGSLTGTAGGGAAVSAGKLVCSGGVKWVDYAGASNSNFAQTGCLRFRVTPNYSGAPAGIRYYFVQGNVADSRNATVQVFHAGTGNMGIFLRDDSDNLVAGADFGAFSPTAGTEYEFEFNFDFTTGATRLFINGVQSGSTLTATVTRALALNLFRIGADYNAGNGSDSSFNDVVWFASVQHTANYTPGYTVADNIYAASVVNAPDFSYTGLGVLQALTAASITESNTPRYILNDKYWNGSAWVASNGTYAQASTAAQVIANIATLTVISTTSISLDVAFTDGSAQQSVDLFTLTYTGQAYSPTGYLEPAQPLQVKQLLSYVQESTGTVQVILKIDGELKYHDGVDWVDSNGSEAQSNTAAEVDAALEDLVLGSNSSIFIRWLLVRTSETVSAEIDDATVDYDFGAIEVTPNTCVVFGYLKNISGAPVAGANVKFNLVVESKNYKEANHNVILGPTVTVTTDVNGYFQIELIRSSEYEGEGKYRMIATKSTDEASKVGTEALIFEVPDSDMKDITDLLTAA